MMLDGVLTLGVVFFAVVIGLGLAGIILLMR
jgi:hypothetical protein